MMKDIKSNAERKNDLAEGMSGASCGAKTVNNCVDAAAEGLSKKYTHPKQGSARDCSVIAALSSIAAVAPARISGAYPNYNFLSGTITLNSRKLPVDASGNLVFASSSSGSWPMLWEKAYAKLISNAVCPEPTTCPIEVRNSCSGEPDIAAAFSRGYAGLTALKEIGRYQTVVTGSIPFGATSGILLWPAIATTNSTLAETAFWKRDHDYSVIKYDLAKKSYLIRNPCGGAELLVSENEFKTGSAYFAQWGHVKD